MAWLQTFGLRTLAPLAAVWLTPVLAEARATPAGVVSSLKDWSVVCDNLRNCQADGFAADDMDKPAILTLTRSGATAAPAAITIHLLDDGGAAKRGKPLFLAVDGRPVLTVAADGGGSAALAPAQVGPLLSAARNGTVLSVRLEDNEVGVVSLSGMLAALRLVDDQQKRVGTVTALVAKGPKPLSAVPPPPAPPVVRRAPAVAQTGLTKTLPAAVKALSVKADCALYQQDAAASAEPEVFRLSADTRLWQIPCGGGAYNFSSLLVLDTAGQARLAPVAGVDDGLIFNAVYDPKTRILEARDLARGIGDCGVASEWAWTGQAFVLTREASMPACHGQTEWPTAFQARVE